MRSVLQWQPWIPLSKLVYGAYLVHMCWQLRSTAMVMAPRYATIFDIMILSFGDIVWSFALALVLYILVEAPARKVFRVLMSPRNREKKEEIHIPERTVINITNHTEDSQM